MGGKKQMIARAYIHRQITGKQKSKGFILIIVMLLLTILSLSAFVAVEQSQFSYKANHARISKIKARQLSEDARLSGLHKLLTLLKNNEFNLVNDLATTSSGRYKKEGLKHFLALKNNNARADVFLRKLPAQVLKNGVSLTQNMAYSGLGAGLGRSGSFSTRFELRAKGLTRDKGREVTFWTASDYRFMP
jgi:hypothetical protein